MNTIQHNPETREILPQRFTGSIETAAFSQGMDTLEVTLLNAELGQDDVLKVPGNQGNNPALGRMGGASIVAKFELGGVEGSTDGTSNSDSIPSQSLLVLKIDRSSDPQLRQLADQSKPWAQDLEGFLLAATDSNGIPEGFTFVTEGTHMGFIGRQSNLKWVHYTGVDKGDKWNPFAKNMSISRQQMTVSYDKGDLTFRGDSKNSQTLVKTRATDQHKQVIAANEEKIREETDKLAQAQKASRGVLRSLIKRK